MTSGSVSLEIKSTCIDPLVVQRQTSYNDMAKKNLHFLYIKGEDMLAEKDLLLLTVST